VEALEVASMIRALRLVIFQLLLGVRALVVSTASIVVAKSLGLRTYSNELIVVFLEFLLLKALFQVLHGFHVVVRKA
jgi:hypothetical protein